MAGNLIHVSAAAPQWAHALVAQINALFARRDAQPALRAKLWAAQLPPASAWLGAEVFILDTNRPAYSDGTDWRYTATDLTV